MANAMIRVPVDALPLVVAALKAGGHAQAAREVEDFAKDYVDKEANDERLGWLARARSQVGKDGEIEFDDDATISYSDGPGQYVLAWVWVDGDAAESEEE